MSSWSLPSSTCGDPRRRVPRRSSCSPYRCLAHSLYEVSALAASLPLARRARRDGCGLAATGHDADGGCERVCRKSGRGRDGEHSPRGRARRRRARSAARGRDRRAVLHGPDSWLRTSCGQPRRRCGPGRRAPRRAKCRARPQRRRRRHFVAVAPAVAPPPPPRRRRRRRPRRNPHSPQPPSDARRRRPRSLGSPWRSARTSA